MFVSFEDIETRWFTLLFAPEGVAKSVEWAVSPGIWWLVVAAAVSLALKLSASLRGW